MDEWMRRAEAAADEALAARDALRHRPLDEVALECLHRGDSIAATFSGRRFTGTVVHTGQGLLVLRTPAGDVDVHLGVPVALSVIQRARSGGLRRTGGAATFLGRLCEHEAAGGPVELGCPSLGETLAGRIAAVAPDHVVLDDRGGQRWFVAVSAISWVIDRPDL